MVWFLLFLWALTFVAVVLLTPKPELEDARPGKLGDLKFPRADAGAPVPIIYGRVRMRAPNTIWYGAFGALAKKKNVKTGWFSSEDVITGYNYVLSMDLALCSGPDVTLHRIWADKKAIWSGTLNGDGVSSSINRPNQFGGDERGGGLAGGIRFYSGGFSQSRNAYLQGILGNDLPAYQGTSHIVFEKRTWVIQLPMGFDPITFVTPFYIGTSPSLRPYSFELSRYPDNLGLGANLMIGQDLNPMEILYDVLTETWGGLGIDPAKLDVATFQAVGAVLKTEGNGMSLQIQSANDVRTVVQEILRQIDGVLFQNPDDGKITVKLIREDYVIGNLPVFDETNVRTISNFSRNSWAETYNRVRVKFNYRKKKYETAATLVEDLSNIHMQGRVKSLVVAFPGVTEEALAADLGTRELSQVSVPLFRCTLEVMREASQLKPGDPFVLSWDDYGLVQVVMRVQRFDFGELLNGRVVMECIQDKFAVASTLYAPPEDTGWQDTDRTPVDITEYELFESPYYFLNQLDPSEFTRQDAMSYFFGLARDPNGLMEGYDLQTSDDIFNKSIITELSRVDFPLNCKVQGTVFPNMGQHDGVLKKLTVKLPNPDGAIFNVGSAADLRADGVGMLYANGEFMGYENFTDNLDGTYDLNNVHRALLDSTFQEHNDGDVVYLLTSSKWLSRSPNSDTDIIYYQFLSFSDEGAQETGDAPTNSITTQERYDRPYPPDLVEIENTRPNEIIGVDNIDVTDWNERNRDNPGNVVLIGDSSDPSEASTTFNLRLFLDGVLVTQQTGITLPLSFPYNLSGLYRAGIGRVEVEAVLAGETSWTFDWWEFNYAIYPNLSAERLTNWNFESGTTGWTVVSGSFDTPVTETVGYPLDKLITIGNPSDDEHLETTGTTNELSQDYTIPGGDLGKSAIVRAYKGGYAAGVTGQLIVELRDGGGALDTITTPLEAVADLGKWELLEIPLPLRTDATTVRVRIVAPAAESVWNNVSLKNHTTSPTTAMKYDTITGLTVEGAWGLRKMDSGYSGALVRLRDTADDSEFDVNADPDGNLEPFFVKGEARVVRLYDQSGNGAHLEAESQGEQPRLRWNMTETGRPHIEFKSGEALLDTVAGTSRPYMVTRPNMSLCIGPKLGTSNTYIATIPEQDGVHTSPYVRCGMTTGATDWRIAVNGTLEINSGNGASNSGKNVWFIDYQNAAAYHNDDVTNVDTWTAADITYPNSTRLRLAESGGGTLDWPGEFHELCIFSGNIAAGDRQTIMEDLSEYWYNFTA